MVDWKTTRGRIILTNQGTRISRDESRTYHSTLAVYSRKETSKLFRFLTFQQRPATEHTGAAGMQGNSHASSSRKRTGDHNGARKSSGHAHHASRKSGLVKSVPRTTRPEFDLVRHKGSLLELMAAEEVKLRAEVTQVLSVNPISHRCRLAY